MMPRQVEVAEAQVAFKANCALGESPRWSVGSQSLLWLDIETADLWRLPRGGSASRTHLGGEPTAIFEDSSGELWIANAGQIMAIDKSGSASDPGNHVDLDLDLATVRTNDGRVDGAGRIWIGTMARDLVCASAQLFRCDEVNVQPVLTELTISNGIGWSPEGTELHHIDSPTREIRTYEFDVEHGQIGVCVRRTTIDDADPDGLTVDCAGGIWVALWGAGEARRYDKDGRHTHTVRTPGAAFVTAPCLGGPTLTDLYLTTAGSPIRPHADAAETNAGHLFVAHAPYPGLPESTFDPEPRLGKEL